MTSIADAFPVELNVHILRRLADERLRGGPEWLRARKIIQLSRSIGEARKERCGTDISTSIFFPRKVFVGLDSHQETHRSLLCRVSIVGNPRTSHQGRLDR